MKYLKMGLPLLIIAFSILFLFLFLKPNPFKSPSQNQAPSSNAIATPAGTSEPVSWSSELLVVGKLEHIEKSPDCGLVHFGAIAKYTDLTVLQGAYTAKEIYVVHGCPEMPRQMYDKRSGDLDKFQVGDYHELHLTKTNVHHVESIVGDKGASQEEIYFCRIVNLKK